MRRQGGCDGCLLSLQVFLVRKSKSFLRVKGLDVNSSGGGWEDAVWSQSNWLLALIDVFRYLGPSILVFSLLISACGSHSSLSRPSLTCSILSVWKLFVGWKYETGTGSIHLFAGLVAAGGATVFESGNLTAVDIWKSVLSLSLCLYLPPPPSPLPCPPTPTPTPSLPMQWCVSTRFYLWTDSKLSSPLNPFWNLVGQLLLGIRIHLEQTTLASY